MIQFWKVIKNIVLPKSTELTGREGTVPCEWKETWEGNVFKGVFRSGKEKREIKVERRCEVETGHCCFDNASSVLLPS